MPPGRKTSRAYARRCTASTEATTPRVGATVPKTAERMKQAGKVYEPVTYEGAGHGFMCTGEEPGATEANKKARDESWRRWLALLAKL
jgi:carboxymethylenebutenolidase